MTSKQRESGAGDLWIAVFALIACMYGLWGITHLAKHRIDGLEERVVQLESQLDDTDPVSDGQGEGESS